MAGEEATTAVTVAPKASITMGERGLEPQNFDELWRFAVAVQKSRLAPSSLGSTEQIFVALQTGMEAGLAPMAALRGMAVINGRPSWMGQTAVAICRSRGALHQSITRRYVGTLDEKKEGLARYGNDFACEVTAWRTGDDEPQVFTYSVADAKEAGLWNKRGRDNKPTPWVTAPKRMLYWRAVGMAMSELFSDILLNLPLTEIAQDIEPERGFRTARDVTAEVEKKPAAGVDPLLEHFEKVATVGVDESLAEALEEPTDAELAETEQEIEAARDAAAEARRKELDAEREEHMAKAKAAEEAKAKKTAKKATRKKRAKRSTLAEPCENCSTKDTVVSHMAGASCPKSVQGAVEPEEIETVADEALGDQGADTGSGPFGAEPGEYSDSPPLPDVACVHPEVDFEDGVDGYPVPVCTVCGTLVEDD
jgi:hypothetical protein